MIDTSHENGNEIICCVNRPAASSHKATKRTTALEQVNRRISVMEDECQSWKMNASHGRRMSVMKNICAILMNDFE